MGKKLVRRRPGREMALRDLGSRHLEEGKADGDSRVPGALM